MDYGIGKKDVIIFITDGFGPKYGGINSFNYDLSLALEEFFSDQIKTINMIIRVDSTESMVTNIEKVTVYEYANDLKDSVKIDNLLNSEKIDRMQRLWWIGHDVVTGDKAIQFSNIAKEGGFINSQSAVFHHMDYSAYQDIKFFYSLKDMEISDAEWEKAYKEIKAKEEKQINILTQADLVFAVGPLLKNSAREKLNYRSNSKSKMPIEIIPGLAREEPFSYEQVKDSNRIISYGRIEEKGDIIKQFSLAAAGFSKYQNQNKEDTSTILELIGLSQDYKNHFTRFNKIIEENHGYINNIKLKSYTEDRRVLFGKLKQSLACLMLSLHEGFGLVGWEAISCGVPLILSESSGLYELLKSKGEVVTALCSHFRVKGSTQISRPFQDDDVNEVIGHLDWIFSNKAHAKDNALRLKEKLQEYTWENAGRCFLEGLGIKISQNNSPEDEFLIYDNYRQQFTTTLVGRERDIEILKSFFLNNQIHFFLLWGVGGMGKSHLCDKVIKDTGIKFISVKCNNEYSLERLYRTCSFNDYIHDASTEVKIVLFIKHFTNAKINLLLDDYYEILDSEIRQLVSRMVNIQEGKLLVISRAIPREFGNPDSYCKYRLPLLEKEYYFKMIDDYAITIHPPISINSDEKDKMFSLTKGYPLGSQLIIKLLSTGETIEDIAKNLVEFNSEIDPEGKDFTSRLLGVIFEKGDKNENQLLMEFSAFNEPVRKEVIKYLPSYNMIVLNNIIRKDIIQFTDTREFSLHPLIKLFAYNRLMQKKENKIITHKSIAVYYDGLLEKHGLDNMAHFETALFHYKAAEEFESFKIKMYTHFRNRHVKELISQNIDSSIKRLQYGIELYPGYMPFYNELGIAFRQTKHYDEAIKILKKAIDIDDTNLHSYNELGICLRETKHYDEAIKILKKAIDIDDTHLPSYNQLGICLRETKHYDEAIKILKKAIDIDDTHLPSYNQLGICLRENGQIDEANNIFLLSFKNRPKSSYAILSLLMIYIFFKPDKIKSQSYFDMAIKNNIPKKYYSIKKGLCTRFITHLDEIIGLTIDDVKLYEKYIFQAVRFNAFHTLLPLLFALKQKYPFHIKFTSALGKSLANPVIGRFNEALPYIIEAIEMNKQSKNQEQETNHILFYFDTLLQTEQRELLKSALDQYSTLVSESNEYRCFIVLYSIFLDQPEKEIHEQIKKVLDSITNQDEYIKIIKKIIDFLEKKKPEQYTRIKEWLNAKRSATVFIL